MNRLRRVPVSLVLPLASGIGFASEPGKTLRVYFVGNSVTDTARSPEVQIYPSKRCGTPCGNTPPLVSGNPQAG